MQADTPVKRTNDFEFGQGDAPWTATAWLDIRPCDGLPAPGYRTRVKLLASETGLYAKFDCDDRRLSCSNLNDFDDLFEEDVVELFLWPDTAQAIYFEYELSPLGAELALLIPNRAGAFMGWKPWHVQQGRNTRRWTSVRGGEKVAGTPVSGWSAELYLPFALLVGIADIPPRPGDRWRANLCRIDYDSVAARLFSWSPGITTSFHEFERFGTLVFE